MGIGARFIVSNVGKVANHANCVNRSVTFLPSGNVGRAKFARIQASRSNGAKGVVLYLVCQFLKRFKGGRVRRIAHATSHDYEGEV